MSSNRPLTYKQLFKMFAENGDMKGVEVRPNTVVRCEEAEDGSIVFHMDLYGTHIASVWPDGMVMINARQYQTNTTKNRLNDLLGPIGYRLKMVRGDWNIIPTVRQLSNGRRLHSMVYRPGMLLTPIEDLL